MRIERDHRRRWRSADIFLRLQGLAWRSSWPRCRILDRRWRRLWQRRTRRFDRRGVARGEGGRCRLSYENAIEPHHRRIAIGDFDDRTPCCLAIDTHAGESVWAPSIFILEWLSARIVRSHAPARRHLYVKTAMFNPRAAIPASACSRGDRDPRHAGAAAIEVEAIKCPLFAEHGVHRGAG